MNAVELTGVRKRYGDRVALDDLTFSVPVGSVCALVGPNGSGKSTTMGLIAGLLAFERGEVNVLGKGRFSPEHHCGRVSLMPQDSNPSEHMPVAELLTYYAQLQGMSARQARTEAGLWLQRVQLAERASARIGQLSHGMRRRFSIAQAMLGAPELILLDEPTSGLDPELVVSIRQLFTARRGECTVIVSSHILSELETTCDHVIFMQQGKCVRRGSMASVTGANSFVRYTLTSEPSIAALSTVMPGCKLSWSAPSLSVQAPAEQPIEITNAQCLRWLLDSGIGVLEIQAGESLEQTYLDVSARR